MRMVIIVDGNFVRGGSVVGVRNKRVGTGRDRLAPERVALGRIQGPNKGISFWEGTHILSTCLLYTSCM